MGDLVLLKIVIEGNQVKAQFLWNDMHRRAAGQGRIHVHHTGIKSIAGISCHLVLWLQVIEGLIPMTEADKIAVHQLTALGHTRRAGGVEQDEEAGWLGLRRLLCGCWQ